MNVPGTDGPIVDAEWLAEHIAEVVVVDCRWYLDGRSGRAAFEAGHLPGAVFADVDKDLSSPASTEAGRHPLPSPEAFAEAMTRLGIDAVTPVVAYDDAGGAIAARLWWMLHVVDQPVAVLDGGIEAWVEAGGRLVTGSGLAGGSPDVGAGGAVGDAPDAGTGGAVGDAPEPGTPAFTPRPWPERRFVTVDALADLLSVDTAALVIDARSAERYRGEPNPVDPRAGHIPTAVSGPFAANLHEGRMLAPDQLRARYEELGASDASHVVAYCGSGVTACHDLLALELAGLGHSTALYAGSWSQWAGDPDRPVVTGPSPEGDGGPSIAVPAEQAAQREPHDPVEQLEQVEQAAHPAAEQVEQVVERLGLAPHPEGGWFVRFFTDPLTDRDGRPLLTAIRYLLPAGGRSHWHRIDADELWAHVEGAPVEVRMSADGLGWTTHLLGPDAAVGQQPSLLVPAHTWQSATNLAESDGIDRTPSPSWSLMTCTVVPGFRDEGFELAPPCWEPGLDR